MQTDNETLPGHFILADEELPCAWCNRPCSTVEINFACHLHIGCESAMDAAYWAAVACTETSDGDR